MAITLKTTQTVAQTFRVGDDKFTLPAGKTLKIETSPDGEEVLAFDAGSDEWTVTVGVQLQKND